MEGLRVQLAVSRPIYTDKETGADLDVAIYEPEVPEGWFFLGHLARRMPGSYEYTNPSVYERAPTAVIVQPEGDPSVISSVEPELRSNNGWQPLWTDQHSGGKQNIEIYSFAPTQKDPNYVPMGLFASIVSSYGEDPTRKPMWSKLVAVHIDLIATASVRAGEIWNDRDSGADGNGIWRDISLWGMTGSGLVSSAAFVAAEGYPDRPPLSTRPAPHSLDNLIA